MNLNNNFIEYNNITYDNINNSIKKYGFVVIKNVITNKQSDNYVNDIWSWLEKITYNNINRNDNTTHITYEDAKEKKLKNYNWPTGKNGIISSHGISHANFVWKARTEKNVKNVFSKLWNTNELLTSFDGICVMKPSNEVNNSWFHFDQSPTKKGLHCIQGFINLQDTTEKDGCLMIYPSSNNYHEEYFNDNKISFDDDWYSFNKTNKANEWMENKGLKPYKVIAPKGSLVLWDSRTAHCSSLPLSNNIRYTIYVCMTPKSLASSKILNEKRKIFKNRIGTNHWPHQNNTLFDESKLILNNNEPKYINYFQLNDLIENNDILELVGINIKEHEYIINNVNELNIHFEKLNNLMKNDHFYYNVFQEEYDKFNIFYNNIIQNYDYEYYITKNEIFKLNNKINNFYNNY